MDKDMKLLKAAIRREADKLICESHLGVCALRDGNYERLEEMVMAEIFSDKYLNTPSVQEVLAGLER